MIYLNYNNLNAQTQARLLCDSRAEVEQKLGKKLKAYAKEHYLNYEDILQEEAMKNLYSYIYIFNI